MATYKIPSYQVLKDKLTVKKPWDIIILTILNILITIPVFIILHQNLINLNWPIHLDRVLLFIVVITALHFILTLLRRITLIALFLYLVFLFYGTVLGDYGFKSMYNDYQYMIYNMTYDPYPQDIIISKLLPFPNKTKIIKAVEFENPKVRNFAIMATTNSFSDVRGYSEYRTIIQCFAVFKEINSRWHYVSDPKGKDYIATASESLLYLSGDCDDHSVLMAACVKSIGGIPRLIHTDGHIYPEILIGTKKDFETINYLIKEVLFKKESKGENIHYHIDERGQIWLNLDYTAHYPGGPFLKEEILGALTLY